MEAMVAAYVEVSTDRCPVGMGIGPVRTSAISEWCDRRGLDHDVAEHLRRVLRVVDAETLRRWREQNKPKKG